MASSPANSNEFSRLSLSEAQIVPWADLPPELLSLISSSLGIVDLLSFRGVCKDWRSASCTASAEVESSPSSAPWFILWEETEDCTLYNPNEMNFYNINFPELKDSTCLASNRGWLLLCREGSIFFFCPFSRARIDLPRFPQKEISDHVAAFSHPPTSLECIVSIINRLNDNTLEINVLKRGDTKWTTHTLERNKQLFGAITGGIFDDNKRTFFYLDDASRIMTFSTEESKENNCAVYLIATGPPNYHQTAGRLPFHFVNSFFRDSGLQDWIELEDDDDVSISICGTVIQGQTANILINNERIEASNGSAAYQLKGIWIQPRFFQIPTTPSWLI